MGRVKDYRLKCSVHGNGRKQLSYIICNHVFEGAEEIGSEFEPSHVAPYDPGEIFCKRGPDEHSADDVVMLCAGCVQCWRNENSRRN